MDWAVIAHSHTIALKLFALLNSTIIPHSCTMHYAARGCHMAFMFLVSDVITCLSRATEHTFHSRRSTWSPRTCPFCRSIVTHVSSVSSCSTSCCCTGCSSVSGGARISRWSSRTCQSMVTTITVVAKLSIIVVIAMAAAIKRLIIYNRLLK